MVAEIGTDMSVFPTAGPRRRSPVAGRRSAVAGRGVYGGWVREVWSRRCAVPRAEAFVLAAVCPSGLVPAGRRPNAVGVPDGVVLAAAGRLRRLARGGGS